MVRVVELAEIQAAVDPFVARISLAEGFKAFSRGEAVLPEVGELTFKDPDGEAHVKLGHIRGDRFFVIKIATGFYENVRNGQPAQDGALLVHERATGQLSHVLLDHGWLTDLRTALAGALVAERLAPARVDCIGIIGTGTQARLQVTCLDGVINCRRLRVWGRSPDHARNYVNELSSQGYEVTIAADPDELAECQLIITTTPSATPLLHRVNPGTHVTCVGTDSPQKNEISPAVLAAADLIVVDSLHQCLSRGDLRHAVAAGLVEGTSAVELGTLLEKPRLQTNSNRISVADLTGLAVQDICMANHVIQSLTEST